MREVVAASRGFVASDRVRAAAATVVAVAVSYVVAQRAVTVGVLIPILVGIGLLAVLLLERPRAVAFLLIVFGAPLARQMVFPLSFGGVATDSMELLSYALVGWWVISRGRTERTPSWRFAGPVLLLVGAAAVGTAYAFLAGTDRYRTVGQFKTYLVYLVVLPLTVLFASRAGKERLERWVVGFCVLGSVVVILAVAVGSDLPSEAPNLSLNTFGVTSEVQRIRPAMLWLLFLATLLVLGRVYADGLSWRTGCYLALFGAVWVFSFNRSSWAALFVCGSLLALLRPGPRRPGRGIATVAVLALVAPVFLTLAARGTLGPSLQAVPARLESIVNPSVVQEHSLRDRAEEYPVAIAALRKSPVLGVGVGRSYGARRPYYSTRLGVVGYEDRPFSHNSFLLAYLQLGLLGMLALGWLGAAAWRAAREARRSDWPPDVSRRIVVGSLAVLGYAIQSLTQTSLLHRPGIAALVIALVLATRPTDVRASE